MAFDPGFPNAAEDAHLIEQKPGTSSTVDDGESSLTVDTDDGSLSTYHKPNYSQLSTETDPAPIISAAGVTLEYTDNGNRYRWTGTRWQQTHLKGAVNIHDADVHHRAINVYVHQHTAVATTISSDTSVSDYQVNVADTTGFNAGDTIDINTSTIETTHPTITNITPGTPGVFELDRRLDVAHFTGDAVTQAIINLSSQIGTLAAPQEYFAGPPPGEVWHIINLTLAMGHGTAGDFGLFGNVGALTNGVVIRVRINGNYGTLTNWKTNGEINVDTGDVTFHARSGGGGTWGTASNGAFKTRTGAIMRLDGDTNDQFEVYVQDDLTGLVFWNMKIQGHLEVQ